MLVISDYSSNIHPTKKSTTIMAPVIISNYMPERLTDGIAMESSYIETLPIPGLRKQARQVQILPKMKTSPPILIVVLCGDGFTTILNKQ